jgi:DNA-binding response OmpR family regulator
MIGLRRIVYIEDDQDLIDLVKLMLDGRSWHLVGVTDSNHAINVIYERQPDVILLDLMMPDIDGWEILKLMRADVKIRDIPVIIITAHSQPVEQVYGLYVAKAAGYLCKPFKADELLNCLERLDL